MTRQSYEGTVSRNELEGGFWELQTSGDRYQLRSEDKSLFEEGKRVRVFGHIDKAAMGIGMTGSYLVVERWESLE